MAPCCNEHGVTEPDSESRELVVSEHSLKISEDSTAKGTQGRAADSSCCKGETCKCDETCMDLYARVICADDTSHLHGADNGNVIMGSGPHGSASDSCTTCCAGSEDASHVVLNIGTGNQVEAVNTDHTKPTSSPSHIHTAGTDCVYTGLRKRSAKRPDPPAEACGQHKSIARNRLRDTLLTWGCICKALLAHGRQSCCSSGRATKTGGQSRSTRSQSVHIPPLPRTTDHSLESCCGKGRFCSARSVKKGHGCRGHTSSDFVPPPAADSCCSDEFLDSQCADICCSSESLHRCKSAPDEKQSDAETSVLQSGVVAPTQHAVLAIRGMTCTGCENKLIRALRAIPAICNVKTSLVLCRAEFDFDSSTTDLRALIQIIERRTGFSAETVVASSTRELLLNIDRAKWEEVTVMRLPEGVEDVSRTSKDTIRVIYDPRTIGARKIVQFYAALSPSLALEPHDPAVTAGLKHVRTLTIRTVASAALTIPVLVMTWAPLPKHPRAYNIASLVLASIVQTVIMGPVYFSAFKSLFFSKLVETDFLVVLSTTAAYVYSVVAFAFDMKGNPLSTGEFFETSTLLVTLITLGQLVSAFARQRAMEAISIRSLQQNTTTLVHAGGKEEEVDARLLQYGDLFKVMPDSSIITDGVIRSGHSQVDESMMTGESRPVAKGPGSTVIAGTLNGSSTLFVEVNRLPGENTISDIAGMVDDARFSRAKVQFIVDSVCGWFVPVVLTIATVTFLVWLAVGISVRKQSGGEAAVTALTYAIAVLAISCPCAVGLAVPMVILVAGGVAAKLGLVFKAATTIESARKISHVVFDKTGTLTQGRLVVVTSDLCNPATVNLYPAILELVKSSRHPVARAMVEYLSQRAENGDSLLHDVEMVTGQGMQGALLDGVLRGGNARWLGMEDHPTVRNLLHKGFTTFCVTFNDQPVAAFGLEDALRPESITVVKRLTQRGIGVSILSGDHSAAVEKVASVLGVPSKSLRSSCLPADKQAYIKELVGRGDKVLFCGDGTNDAVALAQADIGVHLHTGEGSGFAASSAADVVLIHPSLLGILTLFELSEAVARRITLNFIWSAVYNLVAILLAAGAFVHARIPPAYAGLGEIVSVLPVVFVALQLKLFKP
ncbi:hypothetical protein AcV7_009546 [Taiwanofungus camphoratus]|nr:hypothetical protein AcV7_009546 [Antrodia cinnamomea]